MQQNPHDEGLHAPSMCWNSPVTTTSRVSPFISRAIAQPLLQFTDPRSLLFHVQLWNSHPARRHLTRAPAIYGKFPKNTDSGRQTAIFVNSAQESPAFSSKIVRMANRCSSDLKNKKISAVPNYSETDCESNPEPNFRFFSIICIKASCNEMAYLCLQIQMYNSQQFRHVCSTKVRSIVQNLLQSCLW